MQGREKEDSSVERESVSVYVGVSVFVLYLSHHYMGEYNTHVLKNQNAVQVVRHAVPGVHGLCWGVQTPFQTGQWGQTAHCPKHTTDRSVMTDRSISGSFVHRSIHGDGSIDLRIL